MIKEMIWFIGFGILIGVVSLVFEPSATIQQAANLYHQAQAAFSTPAKP